MLGRYALRQVHPPLAPPRQGGSRKIGSRQGFLRDVAPVHAPDDIARYPLDVQTVFPVEGHAKVGGIASARRAASLERRRKALCNRVGVAVIPRPVDGRSVVAGTGRRRTASNVFAPDYATAQHAGRRPQTHGPARSKLIRERFGQARAIGRKTAQTIVEGIVSPVVVVEILLARAIDIESIAVG